MERRHFFLDWVRIGAFVLLVLYHVGMYYVSWDWHIKSPSAGPALEPLMLASAPWRLSLLFFVSGAATAFLRGTGEAGFLRARSWRLLVPLAFGMLVVVVPQPYFEVVDHLPGGYRDGYLAFWGRYLQADGGFCRADGECLILPTWNHLWFVAYLWVYTVLLCAGRWLARGRHVAFVGAAVRRLGLGWNLLLWPFALLALARLLLAGRFESTHALIDDWYNHAQYLPLFLLGAAVARRAGAWDAFIRLRWMAAALAVCGYAVVAWYFGLGFDDANPPPDALRALQRLAWAVCQWSAVVAVIGFAARWAPGDSAARRYFTEAVFPVYILHQTLIIAIAYHARPFGLAPAIEGPLLVLATFAGCFGVFEMMRRVPLLRPLFGLRRQARAVALRDGAPAGT